METIAPRRQLQDLTEQLQGELRSLLPWISFQVQCALRQGELFVLCQHSPDDKPNQSQVFSALQEMILSSETIAHLFPTDTISYRVRLYLKIQGQKPYACSVFECSPDGTEDSLTQEDDIAAIGSAVIDEGSYCDQVPTEQSNSVESEVLQPKSTFTGHPVLAIVKASERLPHPYLLWVTIAIGTGTAIAITTGSWTISRPCVVGDCAMLQSAQELNQQTPQIVQAARSEQDIEPIQQQLAENIRRLNTIPFWSRHYREAQNQLQNSRTQISVLDRALAAERKATEAAQKSQALPQSMAQWHSVRSLWQAAILHLEAIPKANPLSTFTQQRLANYRQALVLTDRRIAAERQAGKSLALAKSTAQAATTREGMAKSLADWQQLQAKWQTVVNALQGISRETTHYAEAEPLLMRYLPKSMAIRDRAEQEKVSSKAYTQAFNLAQQAKAFERQNQWSKAVLTWRNALAQIQQVPQDTFFYAQAQPLLSTYDTALKNAQSKLQGAVASQKVRTSLAQVCAGQPMICRYSISNQGIRVTLTPAYERALGNALTAGRSGDQATLNGTFYHLDTLQSALQTIANDSKLSIEVRGANGTKHIGSFSPES